MVKVVMYEELGYLLNGIKVRFHALDCNVLPSLH